MQPPGVQGGSESQGGALGTRQPWGHRSLEARRPGARTGLKQTWELPSRSRVGDGAG